MLSTEKMSMETEKKEILLAGSPENALTDPDVLEKSPIIKVTPHIVDAIKLASQGGFSAVYIIMSDFGARLNSALETLVRQTDAKIYLLAQMYEEPFAREIVNNYTKKLADDYFICPVTSGFLLGESLSAETAFSDAVANKSAEAAVSAASESAKDSAQAPTGEPGMWDDKRIRYLEKLATEDDLTGLKNRRYAREFLRQVIERAVDEKLRVTLLIFDIDNFKHYNDDFGHATGDNVLVQVGKLIRQHCREHDVVARIGGDEYAVIFWDRPASEPPAKEDERRTADSDHPREAVVISQRFLHSLEKTEFGFLGSTGKGRLTISGGLARFPEDGTACGELFAQADQALIQAKRNGKNQILIVGRHE